MLSHCGGLQLAQATLDRLKADHGAVARRPATLSAALEDEAPRGGGQGGPELKRTTWSMGFFRLWLGSECHSRSYYPGQLHGSFPGALLKGQRLIWSLPKPVEGGGPFTTPGRHAETLYAQTWHRRQGFLASAPSREESVHPGPKPQEKMNPTRKKCP